MVSVVLHYWPLETHGVSPCWVQLTMMALPDMIVGE